MKSEKMTIVFLAGILAVSLSACGFSASNRDAETEKREPEISSENQTEAESDQYSSGETNEFDQTADLEGSVYEFWEDGFSLSVAETQTDGEGSVMVEAAPGSEDIDNLVTITYADDCSFSIVVIDMESLTEVSNEETTSESVKKQTNVRIYGSCQDTYHWTADKIVIIQWQ